VQAGVQKDLASMAQIQLAGVVYTPSSLSAVFQADSDAIDASDTARAALKQAVGTGKTTHAKTAIVLAALRSFLLGYYGKQAVTVLGDFGINAPKSTATKTVATKAAAVVKGKATRAARGTTGSVQKQKVKGNLDTTALEAAINDPLQSKIVGNNNAGNAGNGNAATAPASPSAQPANVAPTPAAPKATGATGGGSSSSSSSNNGNGSTGAGTPAQS
jgi:hypothetical protein